MGSSRLQRIPGGERMVGQAPPAFDSGVGGRYHARTMWVKIALVSVACLLVNIPMGRMRERSKKFSWQWLLWIHASIPLIIALRIWLRLNPIAIPINIAAAVLGQFIGGRPEKRRRLAASAILAHSEPRTHNSALRTR